ncbi:hypothetical protein [Agrobacterium tumefaciens]|uniref:hypothetical protein n=1 Tax=Agrobacterium tumefaciens TaxID=358 RepID=UPI001572C2C7|nr:hypothetical protein [Agrobacterium tumefaciens]WCK69492.1 hypothetical protein G6L23_026805 [Agrobacterium tumefaciens]
MSEVSAAAENMGDWFQAGSVPTIVTKPLGFAEVTIAHVVHDYGPQDSAVRIPPCGAFLIMLYLTDVEHSDLSPDKHAAPLKKYPQGSICLISLARGAAIAVRGPLEALVIHLPRSHLSELAEHTGGSRIDDLTTCRGMEDPTVRDIGAALLPLVEQDHAQGSLINHIALALNAHIVHRYGRSRSTH